MCNFDHFMYFALLKIFKNLFFCSFSHLLCFYYVILITKTTFMDKKIYIFVFENGLCSYFINFSFNFCTYFTVFNSFYAK